MVDLTYDPEADAVYLRIGRGKVDHTEEAGPFIYDVDAEGRILGLESKTLAPGAWKSAQLPGQRNVDAAE